LRWWLRVLLPVMPLCVYDCPFGHRRRYTKRLSRSEDWSNEQWIAPVVAVTPRTGWRMRAADRSARRRGWTTPFISTDACVCSIVSHRSPPPTDKIRLVDTETSIPWYWSWDSSRTKRCLALLLDSYSAPDRGVEYCDMTDEHVCLCVCVCVCLSVCDRGVRSSPNFSACYLWPWLGPPLPAGWCVTYFRFYGWRHICT